MTKVFVSTCHICIEELSYDPKEIKKKCCPTNAFICNSCWDELKKREIKICPICKKTIKIDESYTISINKKYLNVMMNLIIFEIMGFLGITVIVYFLHSDNTTFEKEINYLYNEPFFWFLCLLFGGFYYSLAAFLFDFIKEKINSIVTIF